MWIFSQNNGKYFFCEVVKLLKGFNRRVVVMKYPDSKLFDEAFFIVKENAVFDRKEKSPVETAKRIIRELEADGKTKKEKSPVEILKSLIFLLVGVAIGIIVSAL